jgi:hypothetical protein
MTNVYEKHSNCLLIVEMDDNSSPRIIRWLPHLAYFSVIAIGLANLDSSSTLLEFLKFIKYGYRIPNMTELDLSGAEFHDPFRNFVACPRLKP